jgi:hypothetical protein
MRIDVCAGAGSTNAGAVGADNEDQGACVGYRRTVRVMWVLLVVSYRPGGGSALTMQPLHGRAAGRLNRRDSACLHRFCTPHHACRHIIEGCWLGDIQMILLHMGMPCMHGYILHTCMPYINTCPVCMCPDACQHHLTSHITLCAGADPSDEA